MQGKVTKIRKSIYIQDNKARIIEEYAYNNGMSESFLYNLAVNRFIEQGIVIEVIKSIQKDNRG